MKFLINKKNVLFFLISFFVIALDLATKKIFDDVSYSVLGDLLWFVSATNTGASFGMLKGFGWLFVVVGILVTFVVFWFMLSNNVSSSKLFKVSLAILLGGIWGNLVDRVVFGYVRDFIYLKFIDFAIFNIADIAICVSTVLLVVYILFLHKPEQNEEAYRNKKARGALPNGSKVVSLDGTKQRNVSGSNGEANSENTK